MSGPNPSITGEAIRKALTADQIDAATERTSSGRQAALNEADLRDLEQVEYYGQASAPVEATPAPRARPRSLLDRLLHRR